MTTTHIGPNGKAQELPIDPKLDGAKTTVCWWLLEGPWHPLWQQFVLSVVSLADVEGVDPAKLKFPGATHELVVLALNPEKGTHKVQTLVDGGFRAVGGWLEPIDVVHQFVATDDEMRELAELAARACVDGLLTPSTDDARTRLREDWLTSCLKTLAHMRGEVHAS